MTSVYRLQSLFYFSSPTLHSKLMTGSSVLTASITQNLMNSCLNFLQLWRLSGKVSVNEISLNAMSWIAVWSSDVSPAKRRSSRDWLPWQTFSYLQCKWKLSTPMRMSTIGLADLCFGNWIPWRCFHFPDSFLQSIMLRLPVTLSVVSASIIFTNLAIQTFFFQCNIRCFEGCNTSTECI